MSKITGLLKYCLLGCLSVIFACQPSSQDVDFKVFLKNFNAKKRLQFPNWIKQNQVKKIQIPIQENISSGLKFCKSYRDTLRAFDLQRLSSPFQFEFKKIEPLLNNYIQNFEVEKIHQNDPTFYDLNQFFNSSLNLESNYSLVLEKLKAIPAFFSAAKKNLMNPDHEKIPLAIEQQKAFYRLLDKGLEMIERSDLPEDQKKELSGLNFEAKLSVKDFIAFCESKAFEHADQNYKYVDQVKKVLTVENK